ncbi:DUF6735 family protein [Haladaptatus sp. DJG-WS-42]|uniref:DUF6735 family protein n=1 Tax=Haladaptatus sp. DJG-WS-42 TaxID=3120516 RepID=UPI0030D46EB3
MGHRALVAYEQPDGTYTLHYSQWGALGFRLVDALTESTPFGPQEAVEPTPRKTGLSLKTILTKHLDFLAHEAFYVVSPDFEVTAYLPVWFGLDPADGMVGNGALVPVVFRDDAPVDVPYVEGWVDGAKACLRAHREACGFTPETTRTFFETALPEWFGDDILTQERG